jgi:ethanolamine utilization protein EutQ
MKKLICASDVQALVKKGQKLFYTDCDTIITLAAKDEAHTLGVEFTTDPTAVEKNDCKDKTTQQNNECAAEIDSTMIYKVLQAMMNSGLLKGVLDPTPEKPYTAECDPSGVKVVRGKSVKMDYFDTDNPSNKVYFQELIHKEECSMSAGFLTIDHSSFDWELCYDEIDMILEGTVSVTINGKTLTANQGDVLLVPKGSKVTWGCKSECGRLFYATYPANWPDLMAQQ